MTERMVVIAKYSDLVSANLDRALLESHGIESFLQNEAMGSMGLMLGGAFGAMSLMVAEPDAKEAARIIIESRESEERAAETDDGEWAEENWSEGAEKAEPEEGSVERDEHGEFSGPPEHALAAERVLAMGAEITKPCPRCHSGEVRLTRFTPALWLLTILFLGLPALFIESKWRCRSCGHEWR